MSYLIGLDVGSTSCKAVACDLNGHFLATSSRPTITDYLENGWSELDSDKLWSGVAACLKDVVDQVGADRCEGVAVATMNSTVLLDAEDRPLHPIISWLDVRTDKIAEEWKRTFGAEKIYQLTGINPNSVAGITKIQWIKNQYPELFSKAHRWLQMQDFISYKLTGAAKVSYTNACRTMAFDLNKREWSEDILNAAGIAPALMSEPVRSGSLVGAVLPSIEKLTGLRAGTPVFAGGIDYACGAFATGIIDTGQMLNSTGTSEQIMVVTDQPQTNPSYINQNFTSVLHVVNDKYYMMGMILASGGVFEWFKREFKGGSFDELVEEASRQPIGANGCMLLPYFAGRYSLSIDANAKGAFTGLTLATKRGDVVRSMIEGLCYEMMANLSGMQSISATNVHSIYAIGGAAKSDFWLQMKADVTGLTVKSKFVPESAALGAAMLAGLGAGVYASPADAVARMSHQEKIYQPNEQNHEKYQKIYKALYQDLYIALKEFNEKLAGVQNCLR